MGDRDSEETHRLLSQEQESWIERAWTALEERRLETLARDMASIPSPTGQEKELAQHMAAVMATAGMRARYQPIDETQGNAVGELASGADGPELLLYAPIDTAFSGIEEEDCPWVGPEVPSEMTTQAYLKEGDVIGLGAENPKGYAACVVMAVAAVKDAGIPLRGRVQRTKCLIYTIIDTCTRERREVGL